MVNILHQLMFKQLFQYGFNDTEITSIEVDNLKLEIKLNFDKGIYLLDENEKETTLSKPMQMVIKIDSHYCDSLEESIFKITEYWKKVKFFVEYKKLKKYFRKESFRIAMCYYSNFDSCLLFDGEISKRKISFAIDDIKEIVIQEQNKQVINVTYTNEEKHVAKEFIDCKIPDYIYDYDWEFNNKHNLDVDTVEYYEALFDYAHCILDDIRLQSNFSFALKNKELFVLINQQNNNFVEKNFSEKVCKLIELIKKYIEI